MAYANKLGLSFDASMTSNDFAANLYDIEVTFVTEAGRTCMVLVAISAY